MKITEVRKKLKSRYGNFGFEPKSLTVIKRDGFIVCRYDIISPRNIDIKLNSFNWFVQKTLHAETIPNVYHGRKGIYSNWWVEAIIVPTQIEIDERKRY